MGHVFYGKIFELTRYGAFVLCKRDFGEFPHIPKKNSALRSVRAPDLEARLGES